MRCWQRVLSALAVALAACAIAPLAAPANPLVVQTTAGPVQGMAVGTERQWRGIPYAAPPIGALRWRPPAVVPPWTAARDASAFAPPCIQLDFDTGGTLGSEDCLYLNVFAPATATADSHLAVMVHLHPGGNSGFHPYEDATAFTDRNVIVVTLAYRLGAFGFIGLPALTAEGHGSSGEYGVFDQIAALHWVQDNIAAFGGDPSRVTLFGSSAGSFDTVALVASPLANGLFERAEVQGENRWALRQSDGLPEAEGLGLALSQAAGCRESPDELACLRAVPASDLVEELGPVDVNPWVGGLVLPKSPLELIRERGTVPLLLGFDREEDGFEKIDETGNLVSSYPKAAWVQDTAALVGPHYSARARSLYPPSAYDSRLWAYITMLTDAKRGCPTRQLANAAAFQAPVWRYLYTHVYEDDPYFAQFRALHLFEDTLLWHAGFFEGNGGPPHELTSAEERLSGRMTDYWTNFAKSGDPNGPGLPKWPQYNTASEPTLTLDDQIGVLTRYHAAQCALIDPLRELFPLPWEQASGQGPENFPPGFANGLAHGF